MNSDHYITNHCIPIISLLWVLLLSPAITFTGAQPSPDVRNDQYQYARFTPSVAIIIVVLVAALFLMGFFSIYMRRNSNATGTNTVRGVIEAVTGRARRGLDPEVIENFPTLVYSMVKGLKIGKGALECAVCLNEFEDDETLRLIPKCDHVFHPECIDAWLESHTTCPVCRANLVPQLVESTHPELPAEIDLEDQNDAVEPIVEERNTDEQELHVHVQELELLDAKRTLNRNRTRGSTSNKINRLFPRSHTTGHSLVQPGENTERFTLRLPTEVRKQVLNRNLNRATSMVILSGEGSSRLGYRNTGADGSSRGRFSRRIERLNWKSKSDRWVFSRMPSFLTRMASVKSPKVVVNDGGETSAQLLSSGFEQSDSVRPPI